MRVIKMARDRLGVLIGTNGETKTQIEEHTGIKLDIDSETGDVTMETETAEDPVMALKVVDIVNAIASGFSPERAFRLLNDEIYFAAFDIRDYVGKNPKHVKRIRARMIGTDGKTRRIIEDLSGADISIHRNFVGVIGDITELEIAKTSVDMILNGSEHSSVYRYLENKRRQIKMEKMGF